MDKNVTKIIVAVLLVIIVIFTVTNSLKKSKAKKQEAMSLPTQEAVLVPGEETSPKQIVPVVAPIKTTVIPEKKETDEWGRDPFIIIEKDLVDLERKFSGKGPVKKPELSQLKLTGIILSKEKPPEAIISGELYKIGDAVMGFKISEIKSNSVILKWENQEFVLELWKKEPQSQNIK